AVALLACYKAGIVPVCSLPQHREVEIGQLAQLAGATGYFVQADFSSFDLVAFPIACAKASRHCAMLSSHVAQARTTRTCNVLSTACRWTTRARG
ncbi:MAG TPA: hypothetical protein VEY69_15920, partial [Lautropia sp.]|nr:hypothetical protein [Lautropia sp.]